MTGKNGKKIIKVFVDGEVLAINHFSGIGHYTADLLKAVDKLLFEDEFSHFKIEIGAPRKELHRLGRFQYKNFGYRKMPFSQRVANGLKKLGYIPPIDILFGKKLYLFPNYSTWPTMFSKSVPIIYDLSFIHFAEYVEPKNQEFLVNQVGLSVKRASRIVTISTNSKKEILAEYDGVDDAELSIVYPGVDLHKFYKRSEAEVAFIKAKYGIMGDYLIFVGNIEPRKNLDTLLMAYEKLPKATQAKHSLLIIGARGWLDDEIHNKIIDMRMRGLKVVQPISYVSDADLPALYSGADMSIYISKYEGFGIPPIESMACGTPVISSNNSSLPEVVGDAAITLEATDAHAVKAAIVKILDSKSLRENLISKGYEQIDKFKLEESARILLATLESASK